MGAGPPPPSVPPGAEDRLERGAPDLFRQRRKSNLEGHVRKGVPFLVVAQTMTSRPTVAIPSG